MSDLYAVLDVARDASADEIKRAYRRQAREHHPDAGGDEERFKELNRAYEVLSDPERRRRYDRFGDEGDGGARGGDPFGFGAGFGGIGDVIDAFFGAPFAGGRSNGAAAGAGRDVLVTVTLTLEEVATGAERTVEVEVARACERCAGSGDASGRAPERCATCAGAGAVRRTVRTAFGQMTTATNCPTCGGDGRTIGAVCPDCRGEGRASARRSVDVLLPPGVEDGDRVPLVGEGEAGRRGASAGDLYVQVQVEEHPVFLRRGRDLLAELLVPFSHAALGARVRAADLAGEEREVDVPAGVRPGTVLTVRRAGLPARGGGRPGDLHLRVEIEVPTDLDEDQRALLERLARLRGERLDRPPVGRLARLREALQR